MATVTLIEPDVLDFTMEEQQLTLWCWAATASTIKKFYNPRSTETQCKVANKVLDGDTRCCPDPFPCNRLADLEVALTKVKKFKSHLPRPISWGEISLEISAGKVLCAKIRWNSGSAHCIAVTGVGKNSAGAEMVVIDDPAPNQAEQIIRYDELLTNYANAELASGEWIETYFTKKR